MHPTHGGRARARFGHATCELLSLSFRLLCPCAFVVTRPRVQPVAVTQKKELLAFLRGETSSTPDLDIAGLQRLEGEASSSGAAGAGGEGEGERGAKRQRVGSDEEAPLKPVAQWDETDIIREECALATHHSVLQVTKKVRIGAEGGTVGGEE